MRLITNSRRNSLLGVSGGSDQGDTFCSRWFSMDQVDYFEIVMNADNNVLFV